MPIWRCPHCGTPQAETSRCWVCRRSSTTCSTCRHFRRAIAGAGGYCGLDRKRLPLTGLELRGCWEEGAARAHDALPTVVPSDDTAVPALGAPGPAPDAAVLRLRDFVPVELRADRARARREALAERRRTEHAAGLAAAEAANAQPARSGPPAEPAWNERATLWADLET
jgi:hypothetical protein